MTRRPAHRVADVVRASSEADRLDDITRRRMEHALGERFEQHFERRERRTLARGQARRLSWLVATAGMVALVIVAGWRWLAPVATAPVMTAQHIDPNLIGPYLVAGPTLIGPETRTEALPLGERFRAIEVPDGGRLWADLGRAGRIALVGPGRVTVEHATAKRILLHLERGRLVGHVNPKSGVRLEVEAGNLTVSVVGTVFAVETGVDGGVSVLTGKVKVKRAEGEQVPVVAGQSWSGTGAKAQPLSRRVARRMNAEARPLAARVSETGGTLILTGGPVGARVRLGQSSLGALPLAVRLSPGEHLLRVEAPGHRPRQIRARLHRGKTTRRPVRLEPAEGEELLVDGEGQGDKDASRSSRDGKPAVWLPDGDLARIASEVQASKESLARVRARK